MALIVNHDSRSSDSLFCKALGWIWAALITGSVEWVMDFDDRWAFCTDPETQPLKIGTIGQYPDSDNC
jgi:hypothetical protein